MNFQQYHQRGTSGLCQKDTPSQVTDVQILQKKQQSYLFNFSYKYLIIYLLTFITALIINKIFFPQLRAMELALKLILIQ